MINGFTSITPLESFDPYTEIYSKKFYLPDNFPTNQGIPDDIWGSIKDTLDHYLIKSNVIYKYNDDSKSIVLDSQSIQIKLLRDHVKNVIFRDLYKLKIVNLFGIIKYDIVDYRELINVLLHYIKTPSIPLKSINQSYQEESGIQKVILDRKLFRKEIESNCHVHCYIPTFIRFSSRKDPEFRGVYCDIQLSFKFKDIQNVVKCSLIWSNNLDTCNLRLINNSIILINNIISINKLYSTITELLYAESEINLTNNQDIPCVGDYLYSDMTYSSIYDSSKTAIGICVAPASHFKDGKNRWMSLVNMSATDPENGTTVTGNDPDSNPGAGFCWGASGNITGITNYSSQPNILKTSEEAVTAENPMGFLNELDSNAATYFPRDYDNGVSDNIYPFNTNYYGLGTVQSQGIEDKRNQFIPCPFNQDGSLNTLYSTNGVLGDVNGKANTQLIIAQASKYSTGTITKSDNSEGSYPAAMACYRFNAGVQSLTNEWYLPAEGELAYTIAGITKINTNLTVLGNSAVLIGVGTEMGTSDTTDTLGYWLWSSSLYRSDTAWGILSSNGRIHTNGRGNYYYRYRVRAFLAY